jgi:probable F420-dependent oxidoreductase
MTAIAVGAIVPNAGELPGRLGIGAMARAAEDAGADSVWVSDHLMTVDAPTSDYPYTADGRPSWPADLDYYEALTCCTAMASATERCRVGTAVLILPQRAVLEVAKTAATIDRLSGGRLSLGVGAGWSRIEMEALGYPFSERGPRFDEMLDVLHDCWTGRPHAFAGRHVQVPPDLVFHPRPVQHGGPPLFVGGMADVAVDRAAARGDGWLAIAWSTSFDEVALAERLARLHARRDRGGLFSRVLKLHAPPEHAERLPELALRVAALGFDEVILEVPWERGIAAASDAIAAVCHAVDIAEAGA